MFVCLHVHTTIPSTSSQVSALEFSQYLERYLWPNYTASSSVHHTLSIVIMVNQKFSEGSEAWAVCD
jgi:hypothetical protein